ncbi:MAG: S49 family peptidase [Flavipsychrobacter sp.]
MDFKGFLQVFGRLWLMEETQALEWANIAHQVLISKTMDAIPGMDPRTWSGVEKAYGIDQRYPRDIYRVDEKANMDPNGPVQVIRLKGPLMEDDYCGAPGMATMQQALRAAGADSSIKSIVLFNDSPGGTVAGTHNLAREVKRSKKPVVSFVNKMMASADYWIGSSASEIIADDETGGHNSMIGSIGTKATYIDRSAEMESKGVKVRHIYATKSSRKGKYADDLQSGDDSRIVAELDAVNEVFHASVLENRGQKLKLKKENVLEGDVYTAPDALKYGLIDKLGSFEYAVKRSLQMAQTIR